MGAPDAAAARGRAAWWLPRGPQAAWGAEVAVEAAGLGSVCWEMEVEWAV